MHEAAHVVAAIDRDIRFNHVAISTPSEWTQNHPSETAIGGMHIDPPPSRWVLPDPLAASKLSSPEAWPRMALCSTTCLRVMWET